MPVAPYPTFGAQIGRPAGPGGVVAYEAPGVRVGNPRVVTGPAGAGGVVPYEQGGHGQGFVRVGAPRVAAPFNPPEWPPTGTFDPGRELHVQEGARGLQQFEGDKATKEARMRTDYATGISEYDRQVGEQDKGLSNALALLKEAFTKLGTSQEERANKAGVLQGGALLQAATKRTANEGKERTKDQEAHDLAVAGINRERAKLVLDEAPPDAANPKGGRTWQDLATALKNAQENQVFLGHGEQSQALAEATRGGFGGYQPPAVASSHAQASSGAQRYYNKASGRMETAQQIHDYRRR